MAQMNIANALSGAVALPEKDKDLQGADFEKDPAFMAAMGQALQSQPQTQTRPLQASSVTLPTANVSGNAGGDAGQVNVNAQPQLNVTAQSANNSTNPVQSRNSNPLTQTPGAQALSGGVRMDPRTIGSTTAASMAGLKPWNSQWVKPSNDLANPNLKPLFGESESVQPQGTQTQLPSAAQNDALTLAALAQSGSPQGLQGQTSEPVSRSQKQANQEQMDIRMAGLMAMQSLRPEVQSGTQLAQSQSAQLAQVNQLAQAPDAIDSMNSDSVSAEADLSAKLAALNGSVIASQPGSSEVAQGASKTALKQQLSGSEFIDTLSGVNTPKNLRVIDGGVQNTASASKAGINASSEALKNVGAGARKLKLVDGLQGEAGLSKDALANAASAGVGAGVLAATLSAGEKSSSTSLSAPVVTGNVVQGSGGQDRLSSESLLNISNQVRTIGSNGGGEMRVKLNPENLGELHLKITADGRNVSIEVQAKDDRAKKILEDSMSSLKDGLAAQNLTLGKTEISVSSSFSSQMGTGQDFAGTHHQQSSHDSRGGEGWGNQSRNESRAQNNENRAQAFARNNGSSNMQPRNAAPQGRLDVTA